jgi:uncharacterized membrane protein
MDPWDDHPDLRRKINWQAIIAFIIGALVAYFIQIRLGFGGGDLFAGLITVAVGGLWYHIRRVV